jgi:prepilin-type processing-associated H-X9-DG protein
MDENLVGYLMDTLDPNTHRAVEEYLRTSPEARRRLGLLRQALEPLALDTNHSEPPAGLWIRTLARLAEQQCRKGPAADGVPPDQVRESTATLPLPQAPAPLATQVVGHRRNWWRRADVLVAAVLLIGLLGALPPGIVMAWRQHDINACQNNLRDFHTALVAYSDHHDGQFPRVEAKPPRNFAGIFVPLLHDAGLLTDQHSIGCPANKRQPPGKLTVKELEELREKRPYDFPTVARERGGCYAYTLGYHHQEQHQGLLRARDDHLPIMGDRPCFGQGCDLNTANSLNHGGQGQNVLYAGGHVRFCKERKVGGDDLYLNQRGQIAAGVGPTDAVLGSSSATPYPHEP